MSKRTICRPIAALLAVVMVLMLLGGVPMRAAAEGTTYVLDATADLAAFAAGEKADGDNEDVGTEGYFTVFYSAKTKVDGSSKTFDDGYSATQRLNFGGSSAFDPMKNTVRFTTSAPAEVKLWWVSGGDGRTMTIWDSTGAVVCATDAAESVKNALYISAFFNKAKGIDSNSCPDIIVYDSVAYNNESYNVAFYTNNAGDTDFQANGIISFKDERVKSGLTIGDNLKPRGTQDPAKYLGESNFYWNGSASVNTGGAQITADDFVSLEFTGVAWNADGTIDLQGFLELDRPFDDVRMGEFYYDAVLWAVEKGITNGTAPDTFILTLD